MSEQRPGTGRPTTEDYWLDDNPGDPHRSSDPEARAREERRLERESRRRDRKESCRSDGRPPGDGAGAARVGRRRIVALGGVAVAVAFVGLLIALVRWFDGGGEGITPVPERTITVTVPEGLTIDQIDRLASKAGLRGDYEQAAKKAKGFRAARYGARRPKSLEGFLFPATYELRPGSRVEGLVRRQLAAFEDRIGRVKMRFARSKNLTTYDVLVIASMIEREVQVAKERPLVAAVIYNRLSDGQPLAIDATIRYEDQNYRKPLTESRLETDSRYNTRTRAGLPPTPIGNPGLKAIKAAASPARSGVRFYVVKPGTCGEHFFTSSEDKFLAAQARYQDALERKGGSPTKCP